MAYDADNQFIYILTSRGLGGARIPDLIVFENEEGLRWCIGEDPACIEKWLAAYDYKKCMPSVVLKYGSQVIHVRSGGKWTCVKNRFGPNFAAAPPFTSLEEARVISAVKGWPEPVFMGRSQGIIEKFQ